MAASRTAMSGCIARRSSRVVSDNRGAPLTTFGCTPTIARSPLRSRLCPISAAPGAATAAPVGQLKDQIIQLAGTRYGHDLDSAGRQSVEAVVKQLEQSGIAPSTSAEKLRGSTWALVYTTSTGTSSGKVGPFIADTTQEFPADNLGTYYNLARVGFVTAKLTGVFEVNGERIDLEFKDIALSVGPVQLLKKDFPAGGMKGYWKLSYVDDNFRIFYTNKGNMFVLRKVASSQ